ncbi:hypothetical protein PHET_06057 [Paragonimus heterotremus]|uniref:SET domain-containing protein n=1 Tax=Paragonimus heterotremus TaxID=100268 RepID=A0A8J4T7H2_9TREM|nr:hypothetical protein PHET_06057 [Paragonimus heterotremus]
MHTDDSVSTLWTSLLDKELTRVRSNPQLSARLLRKPISSQSTVTDGLAKNACSTAAAATYFRTVLEYVNGTEASDGLRRMPCFIDDLASGQVEMKSSKKARKYRELGNRLLKSGHWSASASAYRSGLLHAPNAFPFASTTDTPSYETDSTEAALLHGNLSAALVHQQLWSAALYSAIVALELHLSRGSAYPVNTVRRLWSRVICCVNHVDWFPESDLAGHATPTLNQIVKLRQTLVTLSAESFIHTDSLSATLPTPRYGYQTSYPGFSTGLQVLNTPSKGRHVIATDEFEPGDVLAVEPAGGWSAPVTHLNHLTQVDNVRSTSFSPTTEHLILLPSQRIAKCAACLTTLSAVGFVCPRCCDAAYCAPPSKCFTAHLVRNNQSSQNLTYCQPPWHNAECRFTFLLNSSGLGHLCFRLAWLRQNHSSHLASDVEPSVSTLVDHFDAFDVNDLFEYALTAWMLASVLRKTIFPNHESVRPNDFAVQSLWCFDTLRRLQCNAHAITEIQDSSQLHPSEQETILCIPPRLEQVRVATALFLCASMFNHSCEPSVENSFRGHFIVIRCVKPIHVSDEVFNCYGPHYLHEISAGRRQSQLLQQYFFKCDCTHCENPICKLEPVPDIQLVNRWTTAVDQLLSDTDSSPTTLNALQRSWNNLCDLGSIPCDKCKGHWWPEDTTPGCLLDTVGRRILVNAQLTSNADIRLESLVLGLQCLLGSVSWTYVHYGHTSSEYLWELVSFVRVTLTVLNDWPVKKFAQTNFYPLPVNEAVPQTLDLCINRILAVATVLYGFERANEILSIFIVKLSHSDD